MKTAIVLFLFALIIRLAVIFGERFDGLYGQDAYAYFNQAIAITQNLPQGQPPPVDFFWPNGYPGLIAFFMVFAGQTAWAGQLAALLSGAALAPLIYGLGRNLWLNERGTNNNRLQDTDSHHAGLLAGLIVAVAGQPILSSVVIMADMPALFWATLATWLVVRAGQGGRGETSPPLPRSPMFLYLAAGAALALAIISRWLYVLVVPALSFYTLFSLRQRKIPWWSPWPAVLAGAIILAPQLWLSFYKPEGLTHPFLLDWSPAHFWQRQFENTEGRFSYLLPMALFYAQPAGHPAYIFPLLGLASLGAMRRLWLRKGWKSLILLIGWAVPVYIFLAGISFQNFRFGLTLYPPLVILTGFGLSHILSRGTALPGGFAESKAPYGQGQGSGGAGEQRQKLTPTPPLPRSPAVLWSIIILSLAGMLAWAYPMLGNFLTTQNQSKVIAHQVEQILPPEATLITFGLTLTMQHYTQIATLELFYLDEDSLNTIAQLPKPLYVLLDVNSIESQWRNKAPQLNYQWLKEHTTLTEMNSFPPYVLFKVTNNK